MTASLPQSHHDYSFADYLTLERDSEIKHEFDGGEILAMCGGTARHSALAVNIAVALISTSPAGCIISNPICGFASPDRPRHVS